MLLFFSAYEIEWVVEPGLVCRSVQSAECFMNHFEHYMTLWWLKKSYLWCSDLGFDITELLYYKRTRMSCNNDVQKKSFYKYFYNVGEHQTCWDPHSLPLQVYNSAGVSRHLAELDGRTVLSDCFGQWVALLLVSRTKRKKSKSLTSSSVWKQRSSAHALTFAHSLNKNNSASVPTQKLHSGIPVASFKKRHITCLYMSSFMLTYAKLVAPIQFWKDSVMKNWDWQQTL